MNGEKNLIFYIHLNNKMFKKGELNYLCINGKFDDAIAKYPDEKHAILHMLIRHGTIEDLETLYKTHLSLPPNVILSWSTISPILSDEKKIEFILKANIVEENDVYKILKFNYKYIKYTHDMVLNPCRIIIGSQVSFQYIVEELLRNTFTYKDIIQSRYSGDSLLSYLLFGGHVNSSEVINFMNDLFKIDRDLLIEFLRLDDKATILHVDTDNELYKKIIRYIEGRKLYNDVISKDVYVLRLVDILKDTQYIKSTQ